jgi:Brp/Blh family beta-carotene 15,15'-monooxygenase
MAIVISLFAQQFSSSEDLSWQIAIAVFALAVGIPHGSLDHLVTLPKANPLRMSLFIVLYVAIVVAAVFAILKWNITGFQLVVLMSVIHFEVGDIAFLIELDRLSESTKKRFPTAFVAIAFGALPVVIPLINTQSTNALASVNEELINWHQGFQNQLATVVSLLAIVAAISLIITKRIRDLIDLVLLGGLAVLTPPLIAFAVYFGCWHAMRHTARLTLVLPASSKNYAKRDGKRAFFSAVIPGLPALAGSFLIALVLRSQFDISGEQSFFWYALVIVWALTVPHMIVTAKLDRNALSK